MINFFKRNNSISVLVSHHAMRRIDDNLDLRGFVFEVLELISNDKEFFFKNAQLMSDSLDGTISLELGANKYERYVLGYKGVRFIFVHDEADNKLILLSVFRKEK